MKKLVSVILIVCSILSIILSGCQNQKSHVSAITISSERKVVADKLYDLMKKQDPDFENKSIEEIKKDFLEEMQQDVDVDMSEEEIKKCQNAKDMFYLVFNRAIDETIEMNKSNEVTIEGLQQSAEMLKLFGIDPGVTIDDKMSIEEASEKLTLGMFNSMIDLSNSMTQ